MTNATAASTNSAEPFVGDELISITTSTYAIEFHFQKDVLQIGGSFTLSTTPHSDELFEPEKQRGDVQKLWPPIGQVVTKTDWGDTVELQFSDGAIVKILPRATGFRGTIHGKFPKPGTLQIEDF